LERGFRVGGLAVFSRRALQCAGALISRTPEAKTPRPCLWIKEELGCPVTYAVTREKDSETSSSLWSLSIGSYPLRQRAHLPGSINSPGSSHSAHWLYTTIFVSMADLHRLGTACKRDYRASPRSSPLGMQRSSDDPPATPGQASL
jgi:hypothetical protein